MTGGLFDPLGTDRPAPARASAVPAVPVVLAAAALLALAALLAVSYWRDDGDRGRPVAVAPIVHADAPPKPPPAPVVPPPPDAAAPPPALPGFAAVRGDQEVEIQNGVRIIRPRRDPPPVGGRTIPVPDPRAAH